MLCSQSILPRSHPTSAKKILTGLNIVASIFQDHIITVSHGLMPQLATCKLGLESFLGQAVSGWEQQLWGSLQGGLVAAPVLCHRRAGAPGSDVPRPDIQFIQGATRFLLSYHCTFSLPSHLSLQIDSGVILPTTSEIPCTRYFKWTYLGLLLWDCRSSYLGS